MSLSECRGFSKHEFACIPTLAIHKYCTSTSYLAIRAVFVYSASVITMKTAKRTPESSENK